MGWSVVAEMGYYNWMLALSSLPKALIQAISPYLN
jgi:hypothetical protein